MQLHVICPEENRKIKDLKVGDFILCDDSVYRPIKSILVTTGECYFFRLSNNTCFHLGSRAKIKTEKGFKHPELWDTIKLLGSEITPSIISISVSKNILFFHDILIDGNIVSPEGIVFRYGD